jgi:hypothetical protein
MNRFAKRSVQLVNATVTVTTTFDLGSVLKDFLHLPSIWLEATENSGTTTCDVKITGNQDGTNALDLLLMTQLSATGREVKALPFLAKNMKCVVTLGGAGNWTIKVYAVGAFCDSQGALSA